MAFNNKLDLTSADFSTILLAQFDWLKVIWTTRQLDDIVVQVERVSFTFTSSLL